MTRERVQLCEVGPRDGLQDESRVLPVATRIEFVRRLVAAGERVIEVGSFVSATAVPQMAGTGELLTGLLADRKSEAWAGLRLPVLVATQRGLDEALAAGARDVAVFTGATDAFTRRNIGRTVARSLAQFAPLVAQARASSVRVRGYVSVAFGCPFEGAVPVARVMQVTEALVAMGCEDISLGDTMGVATPGNVRELLPPLIASVGAQRLAGHFHDTGGQALANIRVALELGLRSFDSSVTGLGGCPYAPGAPGNVATEHLVALLEAEGFATGISLERLADAGRFIRAALA